MFGDWLLKTKMTIESQELKQGYFPAMYLTGPQKCILLNNVYQHLKSVFFSD